MNQIVLERTMAAQPSLAAAGAVLTIDLGNHSLGY